LDNEEGYSKNRNEAEMDMEMAPTADERKGLVLATNFEHPRKF
jgi:hypothetical protein